jgi:hypothetical protein
MTTRTHETIRVGLRRIIRDDSVSPKVRMNAIELLMRVEGLLEVSPQRKSPKNTPEIAHFSNANGKKLKELLELPRKEKSN